MYRWSTFPFLRITIAFLLGILLALYVAQPLPLWLFLTGCFLVSFGLVYFRNSRQPTSWGTDLAGLLGLLCFLGFGATLTHLRTGLYHPDHLLHLKMPVTHYTGTVADYRVDKPYGFVTTLEVEAVRTEGRWQRAKGKVRLTVRRDSTTYRLLYGDRLLVRGAPRPVPGPANPEQFDFRRFLAFRNTHHQHYVDPHQVLPLDEGQGWSVMAESIQVRRLLDQRLREHIGNRREYGIAAALLLGVKDDLDNEIRTAYANTGTMHVLAVSGLHVGILYGVLVFLLRLLRGAPGYRVISVTVTLAVLWIYAFVTGLSPSVLRAVVMFSLLTVGVHYGRQRTGVNGVAVAAFVLLCLNPYMVMDVGFQLSFLAVLAIIYLQPRLSRLLPLQEGWQMYVWGLLSISLAAQLATFPLGLYYFHQFPVYFLLFNLLVVPWAGVVLWAGLGFLLLSPVPMVGEGLAWVFENMVWLMNKFILLVETLPKSVITGISISVGQTWLLYGLLASGLLFLQFRKKFYLTFTCALLAVLAGTGLWQRWQQAHHQSFVVYSVRQKSVFAFLDGPRATLVTSPGQPLTPDEWQYNIWPHWWHRGVRAHTEVAGATPVFPDSAALAGAAVAKPVGENRLHVWRGLRVLVVTGPLGPIPASPVTLDFVVLQGNPRVRVADLQAGYRFQRLILDSSNHAWYGQRIQEELAAAEIPFHNVAQEGAFVYVRQPAR